MAKQFAGVLVIVLLLGAQLVSGAQPQGTWGLGARLGLFSNTSETPELKSQQREVTLFDRKTNLYLEAVVQYHFLNSLAGVFSLGSYSKGDLRFDLYDNNVYLTSFLGSATVMPMQVGLKFTPFSDQLPLRMQPYAVGGGGFVLGRETVNLGVYGDYWYGVTDGSLNSETDWTWWLGGGVEIPVSPRILIDITAKYLDNQFSGDLAGRRNYSGVQATMGITYLYPRN